MQQTSDSRRALPRDAPAVDYQLAEGSRAYLVVARGMVELNGTGLAERDGAAIENERALQVLARENAEVVLVEMR